ncbi:succinylglutamate-semialdehyde dehydrogenase [Iodidimonas gelatinilytica]|nr:succinylglutamate-semialdehyde dehydrogenase [Iodidimonas gelatinilytica]
MTQGRIYIDGVWRDGSGPLLESHDPAHGAPVWRGHQALEQDVADAVRAARGAFSCWSAYSLDERLAVIRRYGDLLTERKAVLAQMIALETGKPLWDALGEAAAMAGKIAISIKAYEERTGYRQTEAGGMRQVLTHRPHGVMAVFGPYNFPGHLPNGHIVPALMAGNTVVFKPSELTPATAELMVGLWHEAGLPKGVLNLVQGGKDTGVALSSHEDVDGILFTGSVPTGKALHRQTAGQPGKILALEMGGNNPLIVWDAADLEAAASLIVQSAFMTSGQRCTCARRLIVPQGAAGDSVVAALTDLMDRIRIGAWDDAEEPFMGPVINEAAATKILDQTAQLLEAGAVAIRPPIRLERGPAFLSPGLVDVSAVADRADDEIFGPVLQVIRVADFDAALKEANNTRFGLASGLLSDNRRRYEQFYAQARAGIVNWNRPLTGASSAAPFGGIGESGNHRASAYYAADYCAYPVASIEDAQDKVAAADLPRGVMEKDA